MFELIHSFICVFVWLFCVVVVVTAFQYATTKQQQPSFGWRVSTVIAAAAANRSNALIAGIVHYVCV